MKKRLISLLMACCMLLSVCSITSMAAQALPQVEPRWTNIAGVTMQIPFSGTKGYLTLAITGKPGVSNITAEVQLYYKNASGDWVETPYYWSYDVDQMFLTVEETFTAVRGREYKAVMTGVVTKNEYGEPISKTVIDTCPTTS